MNSFSSDGTGRHSDDLNSDLDLPEMEASEGKEASSEQTGSSLASVDQKPLIFNPNASRERYRDLQLSRQYSEEPSFSELPSSTEVPPAPPLKRPTPELSNRDDIPEVPLKMNSSKNNPPVEIISAGFQRSSRFHRSRRDPQVNWSDDTATFDEDENVEENAFSSGNSTAYGCSWRVIFILFILLVMAVAIWWLSRPYVPIFSMKDFKIAESIHKMLNFARVVPGNRRPVIDPERQLTIFYISNDDLLISEVRMMPTPLKGADRLRRIGNELAIIQSRDLQSPLPSGSSIAATYLQNGILYVELTRKFLEPPAPTPMRERLAIYAIVNSFIMNEPEVKAVRFMIDGTEINTAWGWMDLSTPLEKNLSLVRSGL